MKKSIIVALIFCLMVFILITLSWFMVCGCEPVGQKEKPPAAADSIKR